MIILARKVLPITRPDIDNGALVISNGKIRAVGSAKDILKGFKSEDVLDLGQHLVMPGLVNLHTHLELSNLHNRVNGNKGFFDWIESLVELRRTIGTKGQRPAAAKALKAMIRSGTTCIGDISSTDAVIPDIIRSGIRALVFLEVIGLDKAGARGSFDSLMRRLTAFDDIPGRVRPGISPHAPYSVSASLFMLISDYISSNKLDISIHLSETKDEMLHFNGKPSGFDGYMKRFGWDVHDKNKGKTSLGFIKELGLAKGFLAVHAVHITKGDMAILKRSGATVAYCPRSNDFLGVGKAPVDEFLARGINVGFGTDSLASNTDLDLWEEMRFACRTNEIPARSVIEMATINGARGLGLGDLTGSIEPGKFADLISIDTGASRKKDPYPLLLDTNTEDISMTMIQGKPRYISESLKGTYGF